MVSGCCTVVCVHIINTVPFCFPLELTRLRSDFQRGKETPRGLEALLGGQGTSSVHCLRFESFFFQRHSLAFLVSRSGRRSSEMISTIALQVLHRLWSQTHAYWFKCIGVQEGPFKYGQVPLCQARLPHLSFPLSFPLLFSFLVVFCLALKIYTGLELKLSNAKQCV